MHKAPYVVVAMLCTASLIAGCNLPLSPQNDGAAVQTAAALTVQAQIASAAPATFTAVPFPSIPPANTQVPVNTVVPNTAAVVPTATSNCDNADFVTDISIPDETVVDPGESFAKTWRIRNAGNCSWTPGYSIVFVSGNDMDGPAVQALAGNVNPGQTVDLSVNLTAPSNEGDYTGNWGLRNASGVTFGHFWVKISVATFEFAVTGVGFNVTGACPNFQIRYTITTNGAGTVKYHRIFKDGGTDTTPVTLEFDSAGSQSKTESAYFGVAGSSTWIDIYIDEPNGQRFRRATLTCP